MLSKISSLFNRKSANENPVTAKPNGHPTISDGDMSSCPFMNKNKLSQSKDVSKCPVTGHKTNPQQVESDSENQEKPTGGCPFMGTSAKKKNPSLGVQQQGYNEPFVSKFKYYLSPNKLDFSAMKKKHLPSALSREHFDQMPIYLQHTLFFNGEDYKKARGLECCSRFMAYEQLREKGNKHYNKKQYYQALDYYERAMSLFRWLEYHENMNQSMMSSVGNKSEKSQDEVSEASSKIQIDLTDEEAETKEDPFDDLRSKYKEFFVTYCDENVKEYNGQEMQESADIDMRKSLLVQIYLNMAAAYMQLHHYSLAEQAIKDGLALSDKVSQLYFRLAQSIALRMDSSSQRMLEAKELIEKALTMRPHEKIFSTANANILKMLNLHDAEEAYKQCYQITKKRLHDAKELENQTKDRVYERACEIHKIEQRMIKEGKTPRENMDEKTLYQSTQMKILQRMLVKYARVVEFYTEAKNKEQVDLAKKEFQEILRIKHEVDMLFAVIIEEKEGQLGGIQTEKIQKRINNIKTRFSEEIYNKGRFNFTMLQWVIKEIVKQEAEQEKKRKEEEARLNPPAAIEKKNYTKLAYILIYIPLVLLLVNYLVI